MAPSTPKEQQPQEEKQLQTPSQPPKQSQAKPPVKPQPKPQEESQGKVREITVVGESPKKPKKGAKPAPTVTKDSDGNITIN